MLSHNQYLSGLVKLYTRIKDENDIDYPELNKFIRDVWKGEEDGR